MKNLRWLRIGMNACMTALAIAVIPKPAEYQWVNITAVAIGYGGVLLLERGHSILKGTKKK